MASSYAITHAVKVGAEPAPVKRKPRHHPLTEQRIAHIAELIRTLRWHPHNTPRELSRTWGIGQQQVRNIATEAARVVRSEVADPEAVSLTVGAALDIALRDAVSVLQNTDAEPEERDAARRAVIAGSKVWADVVGLTKTKLQVELSSPLGMTTEQLRGLYEEAARTLGMALESAEAEAEAEGIEAEAETETVDVDAAADGDAP